MAGSSFFSTTDEWLVLGSTSIDEVNKDGKSSADGKYSSLFFSFYDYFLFFPKIHIQ